MQLIFLKKKKKNILSIQGFSLIEMSIVIVIVGLIAASALSIGSASVDNAKLNQTITKMKGINEALASYVALNQRLPCPADPSLAITDPNYGTERANCTNNMTSQGVYKGILPYKVLQLPPLAAQDGYGNLYSYAVSVRPNFTSKVKSMPMEVNIQSGNIPTCRIDLCPPGTSGTLQLVLPAADNFSLDPASSASISVLNNAGGNRTAHAVYVLISHGKNGFGAWTTSGSSAQNGASSNAQEQLNYGPGPTFVQQAMSETNNAANNFDDIVVYREKGQILKEISIVLSADNCLIAQPILNRPQAAAHGGPSEFCYGTADPISCSSFLGILAEKVLSLCP